MSPLYHAQRWHFLCFHTRSMQAEETSPEKPLHHISPSSQLPLTQPQTQTCSSLHTSCTTSFAKGLSSSSTASLPSPMGTVTPSSVLPHHRFLWLWGLTRLGRPCAGGEGAATALPKGCSRSSAESNGVERLFMKQGPTTGASPGPPGQWGEPTR